jgi:hypothetical protein
MRIVQRRIATFAVAAALAAMAEPARAQAIRSLDEGTRVRVHLTTARRSVVAEIAEVRRDTLVLTRPGTRIANELPVALTDIQRLDISGGRRRLTLLGGLVGTLTGALMVAAYNSIVQSQCQPSCPDRTPVWAGAAVGGTALGVGFHFLSAERWYPIALPERGLSPTH